MKVNASSTFGNFKWFGECDVTDAQAQVLANLGFLWVMQRTPSSVAEKTLAGYEKRPEKFERKSIEFSTENATRLQNLLANPAEIEKDVKITPTINKVEEHVIGAGAEPVYKQEKIVIQRHINAGDLRDWAAGTVAYDGRDLTLENVEFLKAVKAYIQDRLKGI